MACCGLQQPFDGGSLGSIHPFRRRDYCGYYSVKTTSWMFDIYPPWLFNEIWLGRPRSGSKTMHSSADRRLRLLIINHPANKSFLAAAGRAAKDVRVREYYSPRNSLLLLQFPHYGVGHFTPLGCFGRTTTRGRPILFFGHINDVITHGCSDSLTYVSHKNQSERSSDMMCLARRRTRKKACRKKDTKNHLFVSSSQQQEPRSRVL